MKIPMTPSPHGRGAGPQRRGVAAVEFAVVTPVLFLFVFGTIEFGRVMMVKQLLSNSVREGSRIGVLDGTNRSEVESVVKTRLGNEGIPSDAITIKTYVNGTETDPGSAVRGDAVTVTVTVPFDSVSYLPSPLFMGGRDLGASLTMRRE